MGHVGASRKAPNDALWELAANFYITLTVVRWSGYRRRFQFEFSTHGL